MSQSNSFTRLLIKGAAKVGCAFMIYTIYDIYVNEKKIKRADALKDHRRRMGQPVEDSQVKTQLDYVENHFGRNLSERVYSQHYAEDQIKFALQRKKEVRERMRENMNDEEMRVVDSEIQKLDEAFTRLRPKVVPRITQFLNDKDR